MTVVPGIAASRSPWLRSLAATLASAPDAVVVHDRGVVVVANQCVADLLGYADPTVLLGRSIFDGIAPESRPLVETYGELRRQGDQSPSHYQLRGQRADGTTFQLEVRGTTIDVDGRPHTMAFLRDVTSQLVAEEALREREAMYRALFEVNAAIKLLIDPADGRIVDANPAAAQFYGWSCAELRAMTIHQINVLGPAEIAAEMARASAQSRTSFAFRHRTCAGAIADVEVHSGPLVLHGKTLLLSIIHDVTERNRFETQLRRSQHLESIGRLAAGLAHDFNNVLTVISASAQLAARDADGPRLAACLSDIREAAARGATLTGHLLALGRVQTLAPAAIGLTPLIERLAETLRRVLGTAIVITVDAAPELPRVVVDPGQLELALLNLALNARDAMPTGGHLALTVAPAATRPPGLADGDYLAVTVTDTGAGMDRDTQARIFEPFFTTKAESGGTGLGLASALGFLSQSGGTITVDSQPGAGTRFTLYLPLAPHRAPAVTGPPPLGRQFRGTIVLVDDRDDVRGALVGLLGELGFTTHAAGSVAEALAVVTGLPTPPDLVLSDITMPGRSGIELAIELAATRPDLPVVLMSADLTAATRLPGGVGFLPKPFDAGELTAVLRQVAPACVR